MQRKPDFQPQLFAVLKNYSREKFISDLLAGIIVGIVALPLAIAFGIASGVSPEQGLVTAIIAGFIIYRFKFSVEICNLIEMTLNKTIHRKK